MSLSEVEKHVTHRSARTDETQYLPRIKQTSLFGALEMKMVTSRTKSIFFIAFVGICLLLLLVIVHPARFGKTSAQSQNRPWMNTSLSPDERAALVLKE